MTIHCKIGGGCNARFLEPSPYPADGGEIVGIEACQMNALAPNAPKIDPQAAARAIGAGLICLPDACDMAFILRRRLGLPERIWLAISSLLALPPDDAEELAEAALHDLRAGPPIPPFMSIRDAAMSWATFASRGELRAYLGAIWGRLPDAERTSFLGAARPKRRAA